LWYPHWLFAVLGVMGIALVFFSTRAEDRYLTEKFGDEYKEYMKRVPGMNFITGTIRLLKRRKMAKACNNAVNFDNQPEEERGD
jgi:hypothetical protein